MADPTTTTATTEAAAHLAPREEATDVPAVAVTAGEDAVEVTAVAGEGVTTAEGVDMAVAVAEAVTSEVAEAVSTKVEAAALPPRTLVGAASTTEEETAAAQVMAVVQEEEGMDAEMEPAATNADSTETCVRTNAWRSDSSRRKSSKLPESTLTITTTFRWRLRDMMFPIRLRCSIPR